MTNYVFFFLVIIPFLLEIVEEKQDYLRNEVQTLQVESDRRRTSMLCQGILDPCHYLAALSDFVLSVVETMKVVLRPPQPNGKRGK